MNIRFAAAGALVAAFVAAGSIPTKTVDAASTSYAIDTAHSYVIFRVKHMGVGYAYGRFNEFSGNVVLDDDATKSSVTMTVDPKSVDTGNAKRDEHLRNPDFFNCAQFPDLKFESTAVKKVDANHLG
jgi:polyisoprenoid-binding protein YceI